MRIVHYHPRALVGDGGVSNSVRRLSSALHRRGADAVIAYDGADGPPPASADVTWVPVRHAGARGWRVPTDLDTALTGADVVVLNSAWTAHNARAGAVARHAGVPYILAARGAYDPLIVQRRQLLKRAWWAAFERRLVRGAAAHHVFFDEQAPHIRRLGFGGAILVAPNGITVPDDVVWDGGSGGYVLYLGRFDPEHKGLDVLLRAVAAMPDTERPTVRLHGPDWRGGKDVTAALVRQLDLGAHVTIGSALYGDEKWAAFATARAFAYPSRWEGFGNSLAEAAAIGVPTLATPYPLAAHLQRRGAAVVADPTPSALAEGLREALQTSVAADRAREIRYELSWDNVAQRWLDQVAALL